MPRLCYTVTATLPDAATADRYLSWLTGGHCALVLAGGAESASITRLDTPPGSPPRIEVRYLFPDRPVFDRYVTDHAPRLREDGLRQFPPESGISFERRTGEVVATL